jgi:hypothetical protein
MPTPPIARNILARSPAHGWPNIGQLAGEWATEIGQMPTARPALSAAQPGRHTRGMDEPAPARPGDMRFTETGDVEIFDGRSWTPIRSVLADPDGGIRGEPGADEPTTGPP